jgi:hypothetical protein
MCTEALFEKLTTFANCFEVPASGVAPAIISPQIAQRLFTFKDCGGSNHLRYQPTRGDVGTVPAFWETHFHCAR